MQGYRAGGMRPGGGSRGPCDTIRIRRKGIAANAADTLAHHPASTSAHTHKHPTCCPAAGRSSRPVPLPPRSLAAVLLLPLPLPPPPLPSPLPPAAPLPPPPPALPLLLLPLLLPAAAPAPAVACVLRLPVSRR